jgi:hypothetical protein
MKKYLLSTFIIMLLFLQGCGGSSDENQDSTVSVLLALYTHPREWQDDQELNGLIEATQGDFIAIVNPSNGPGLSQSAEYLDGLDYLLDQNVSIVAYIYTSYGSRNKQDIYNDIDTYVSYYGTKRLKGVFFDEVSLKNDANQTFIKEISTYARSKNLNYIVLNPGTGVDQSIIDENYYNLIVTYENPYNKYINFKNTLHSSAVTKQSLLVYGYPELQSYTKEIEKAKAMHYDYIYLTTDNDSNPWDSVFNFLRK